MKILVCGGAGFIGSNFIRYYLSSHTEDEVINYDKLTYAGNLENLKDVEKNPRYVFVKGDIADRGLVEEHIRKVDTVINFAAESHVDRSIINSSDFIQTNVVGTHVLLEAVKKYNKRFHHISTDEVFGTLRPGDAPFNESTTYNPRSPYSASKAASDHLVRAYFHTYNIQATISNCSNNYGPYQFPEKLHGLFITNLLENKKVPVYGDGLQVRDWLYVEDHCRAIDMILQKGKIGETYCVGGGQQPTNLEVAKKILQLLDKDESYIEYVKDRPGHDRRYDVDFSKIKNELGWEPKVNFEEGMRRTVEWYRNNESWWRSVKNGDYQAYYLKQYGSI